MNRLFKTLKYIFLAYKERSILIKLKKKYKGSYINNTSKSVIKKGVSLTINSETQKIIADVKENVSIIVKKTDCNPNELLEYIKTANTPIYKIDNADKLLNVINEEEGLIYEKHGIEALYLSIITGQGIKLKTNPMFILREGIIDKYYMLHNFYRWFALKSNLPGFDTKSQEYFKYYLIHNSDEFVSRLSMEEILSLQEAIARDQEATTFVLEYTKQIEGSQNVMNKLKTEGSANI